jgi:hypothetical protein
MFIHVYQKTEHLYCVVVFQDRDESNVPYIASNEEDEEKDDCCKSKTPLTGEVTISSSAQLCYDTVTNHVSSMRTCRREAMLCEKAT